MGEAARRGRGDRPGRGALEAAARRQGRRARRADRGSRARRTAPTAAVSQALRRDVGAAGAPAQAFALPVIDELAAWPRRGDMGRVARRFERLAPRVLRTPAHVLRVLADLRPMADVGPIDLDEARRVLSERLLTLESEPPARRFGRVFVGTPQQARGRSFRVVFVPGPGRADVPAEAARGSAAARRAARRRPTPSLRDAAAAARGRAAAAAAGGRRGVRAAVRLVSAHRADRIARARAVVLRARRDARGHRPHSRLRVAGSSARARPATRRWPGRRRPSPTTRSTTRSTTSPSLRQLLDERDRETRQGARALSAEAERVPAAIGRSTAGRAASRAGRSNDGLTACRPTRATMLAAQRLTARPYSLSALQRFAPARISSCSRAIYRLQPLEQPEPLQRMDPLTRGSIFHEIQARFFRALKARGALPVTAANLDDGAMRARRGDRRGGRAERTTSWRPPSSASGTTRSRRSAATCTRGCTTSRATARNGSRGTSSSASDRSRASATRAACATR